MPVVVNVPDTAKSVTERVDPEKVKSETSLNKPLVPYIASLPAVWESAVKVDALNPCEPISKSVDAHDHVLIINNDMINENSISQMKPFAWLEDTINKIIKKTKKKIVIRLHPNQSKISNDSLEKINKQCMT